MLDITLAIDPRQLGHLLAIDEHGSLTRAAEVLNVSQPALSSSVGLLERRLGAQVLIRTGRGVIVNELGKILVRRAKELRSLLLGVEEEVRLRRTGRMGPLAIGATPSMVEHVIPQALAVLRQGELDIAISVIEGLDGPLNEVLLNGELDLVIGAVEQPGASPDLVEEVLMNDPFVLAVGYDSAIAERKNLKLSDVQSEFWVLPRPGGSAHAHVQAIFLASGVVWPENCINTNSAVLTKQLVARSNAIALVNTTTLAGWQAPIKAVNLAEAGARKIGIRRRKISELSPLAHRFVEIVRRTCSEVDTGMASE
ncbi:MAG: LysR family transcriptional regulator [Janthinobacterium lividum]